VELAGVAGPDDSQGLAFPYELCTDREVSRDMALDHPDKAFAFPAALHGHQAMKLRILRRVYDELAHDQSQLRGGIDPIESANAVAQPGEKTDGEFIHNRHPKFFLGLEKEIEAAGIGLGALANFGNGGRGVTTKPEEVESGINEATASITRGPRHT